MDATAPTPEIPAGGLDLPAPAPPLEVEAFPGQNELAQDERNRWLVLHFSTEVIFNATEVPDFDSAEPEVQRHQAIAAFWKLLIELTKRGRRFSLVFRTFSEEQLSQLMQELQSFCQGEHPGYSGRNKTQKPPPMNGDKGSRDMRLSPAGIGRWDRENGQLQFPEWPPVETRTEPTTYTFPPYHEAYAGLTTQILESMNTIAIVDDLQYWQTNDSEPKAGKLLLLDRAETKVQHIFFEGRVQQYNTHRVDVRDVVTGEPLLDSEVEGLYLHQLQPAEAAHDPEYFLKAVEAAELKLSKRIVHQRRAAALSAMVEEADPAVEAVEAALPPKEYLYRNVIPALLPALEACQRDRPADPLEFIAFYMLRHSKQYTKTLKP